MKVNLQSFNRNLKESFKRFLSSFVFLIFYLTNTIIMYSLDVTEKMFYCINKGIFAGIFISIF
ncbi:hypothetical protein, partial [Anaerofustis stercorihominis]|uniref:hypothetical protein n=1 Tax=Anaerofustis stercorihominis TaxID=214853 RepID=UPI001106600C